ncbi:hypothetical protein ACKGJI_11620 [Sulfurospirillum sp. 1307]|jgi:hypothetical protein
MEFKQLEPVDDISGLIKEVFDIKLDISGGWGYDHKTSVVVHSLDTSIDQFLNLFANLRANIEMNMTLEEDERYGGINVHFLDGEQFSIDGKSYDHIRFEITAMREKDYAKLIQEYKDNYGKNENFDMDEHFKKRKELSVKVTSDFWFEGLERYYVDE